MAKIRKGSKAALLIVDVQVGVMRDAWEASRIIRNIVTSVDKARSENVPVIWVQHSDEELVYGSNDWQIPAELSPRENETRIYKLYNSAFEETTLEKTLAQLGVSHIVLAGAATNWCIRATAYAALERGYDLTLVKDAHTTRTIELENGDKIEAANIIDELNIVMQWVSYPDRKNRSVPAADLEFAFDGAG
jgi:nicotinamidase-related amidase